MPQRQVKVVVPSWIRPDQPLYQTSARRRRIEKTFATQQGIFLNIPYSPRYAPLELAILSTVTAYGLVPHMARDRLRLETRSSKIAEMILSCRYGLADISYGTRMNLPLELGMMLAFGKETFITSRKPYGALRSISDLNFADVHYHRGSVRRLIAMLSRWIEQNCSAKRLTTDSLYRRYRRLRRLRQSLGEDFHKIAPHEFKHVLGVLQDEFRMMLPGG